MLFGLLLLNVVFNGFDRFAIDEFELYFGVASFSDTSSKGVVVIGGVDLNEA